jgi:NADPH:quinone reductase-like Zn-dependent oxidoreductase
MKTVELQSYGGADALQLSERAKPEAGPGQVLVKISATSLSPLDPKRGSGDYKAMFPLKFPFVPGGDFSGVVDGVGEGVTDWFVGDAVFGFSNPGGTYAEWIAIDATKVALKPANLSHNEAASIVGVGQSAVQAIAKSRIRTRQTVLIHGAGGAVGGIAVQLAHGMGAKVIAITSAADAARVKGYGADEVIDRSDPFEKKVADVDAVIDTVGGDVQARSFGVLKKGGMLVALTQPPSQEVTQRYGVRAIMMVTQTTTQNLDNVRTLVEEGKFLPYIADTMPLWDAAKAWNSYFKGTRKGGKTVFTL